MKRRQQLRYGRAMSWRAIGIFLVLLGWSPVQGRTVDPYVAEAEVADRSDAARQRGFDEALRAVLTKLTGQPGEWAIGAPGRLVRQYRYLDESARADDLPVKPRLEVRFDPAGVRELAASQGLWIWPLERGDTVVWVAVERRGQRTLLGLDADHAEWLASLERHAARRAMPVILPLLDLEDQARISAAEIWGGFSDRIAEASARYGADYQLIGRIAPDRFEWTGRWLLDVGTGVFRWDARADSVDEVLAAGVDGAATRLAEIFSVPPAAAGAVALQVRVSGVRSPADFARVQAYLNSLSVVESARLAQVEADVVMFRLETGADAAMLSRVLARSELLQPDPEGAADALHYRVGYLPPTR